MFFGKNSHGAASAREGAICIIRRKCLEGTQRREGNDQGICAWKARLPAGFRFTLATHVGNRAFPKP